MITTLYEDKLNDLKINGYKNRITEGVKERAGSGILIVLFFSIYIFYKMETGYKYLDSFLRYAESDEKNTKQLREIIGDDSIQIYKINSSQVNAFTYKGPSFYYYTGLVNKLQLTNEELVAILLHEYGHYKESHTSTLGHTKYTTTFFLITSVLMVVAMQAPIFYNIICAFIGLIYGSQFTSRLQRYTEIDADGYIIKYGYKKHGSSAFRKLYEYEQKMICDEMDTPRGVACDSLIYSRHTYDEHPPTVDRIKRLETAVGLIRLCKTKNFSAIGKIYNKVKELIKRKKGE